jgi:mannose-6-phosphate isomerase-like protein (cupin superfamily)
MSDYRLVNIRQSEDLAKQYGMGEGLEARFPRKGLELEQTGIAHYRLAPGYRLPFGHAHEHNEEIYLVIRGTMRVKLDDEIVELGEWDALRVPPGVMHGWEAGDQGAEMLAFGPHEDNEAGNLEQGWWTD